MRVLRVSPRESINVRQLTTRRELARELNAAGKARLGSNAKCRFRRPNLRIASWKHRSGARTNTVNDLASIGWITAIIALVISLPRMKFLHLFSRAVEIL